MGLLSLPNILALLTLTSALPANVPPKPLPLLIWHGLGERYDSEGLRVTGALAKKVHPGTHVHLVHLDDDGNQDRTATFFGNVTSQIERVCKDVKEDSRLRSYSDSKAGEEGVIRVDALGFSQGGQFLRGLQERCDGLSIRSLVTFGSQHNGIAQFQVCADYDFLCNGAIALFKGNAWTEYVQSRLVPAQYYRTLNGSTGLASDDYLDHSNFLADINNERAQKNEKYKQKIAEMENFVMYIFSKDKTVIPKESGWFAEVNATSGDVTLLRDRTMYKEDWLGLKKLDEKGGLLFKTVPGAHMEIKQAVLADAFESYFGAESKRKGGEIVWHGAIDEWPLAWDREWQLEASKVYL